MAIDEKTVRHVAKLAKLEIKEEEISEFTEQMGNIVEMVEKLESLETEGVHETYHGITLDSVMREDKEEEGMNRSELFRNVKSEKDGFIKVPSILNDGESGA